ncbi:hypothetical protein SPHINGO391_470399 [Sphingomonas aurantiaca]|uniref:Uncharacterized protein n=1 Tax=Sphingomonas aurantiaca TaxID=185949 RepID=A0A5E7ZU15_9SPHN|nr:hypothetical protein SPHINGO391_470399 [Sphingomonas aurantiaca]
MCTATGAAVVAVAGPTAPSTQVVLKTMVQRTAATVRAMSVLIMVGPL